MQVSFTNYERLDPEAYTDAVRIGELVGWGMIRPIQEIMQYGDLGSTFGIPECLVPIKETERLPIDISVDSDLPKPDKELITGADVDYIARMGTSASHKRIMIFGMTENVRDGNIYDYLCGNVEYLGGDGVENRTKVYDTTKGENARRASIGKLAECAMAEDVPIGAVFAGLGSQIVRSGKLLKSSAVDVVFNEPYGYDKNTFEYAQTPPDLGAIIDTSIVSAFSELLRIGNIKVVDIADASGLVETTVRNMLSNRSREPMPDADDRSPHIVGKPTLQSVIKFATGLNLLLDDQKFYDFSVYDLVAGVVTLATDVDTAKQIL